MDSYDHIYREYRHSAIADARARFLEGILKKYSTLTENEAVPSVIQNSTKRLDPPRRLHLYPIYLTLPHPTVREADALFVRLLRQLNNFAPMIFPNALSGTSSIEDTLRVCIQSTNRLTCNVVTSPMGACPSGSTPGFQMCTTHPGPRHHSHQPLHCWVP